MKRAQSIFGLTSQLVRMRWARLGRGWRLALFGLLVAAGIASAAYGRCLTSSACPMSGGCPYSQGMP